MTVDADHVAQTGEGLSGGDAAFRLLVESVHDYALILLDLDGHIRSWNPGAERTTGHSGRDVLGHHFSCFFPPQDAERGKPQEILEQAAKEGRFEEEAWRVRKEGTRFWAHVVLRLAPGPDGRPLGFTAVLRDVTERRRAEQRLAAHHVVTGILAECLDLNEVIPRLLQTVCQGLGWDMGVFWALDVAAGVLQCVQTWHPPGLDVSQFKARSRDLTLGPGVGLPGRVWVACRPLWVADVLQEPCFTRTTAAAQEHLHGALALPVLLGSEVLGVLEFFSRKVYPPDRPELDVMATLGSQLGQFIKRRQAEQELRDSEERYRLLAEHVAAGVFMLDEEGTILYVNPAAEKIFGYSAEEMRNQNMTLLMPESLRQGHRDGLARYRTTRRRQFTWEEVEFPGRHKTGRLLPLQISFGELINRAGKHRFVGLVQDLTERNQTQERLQEMLARLQALAAHQESVREEERTRIARAIHDELGQGLTGLKMDVAWIQRWLAEDSRRQDRGSVAKRLADMSGLLDTAIQEVRHIATALRPRILDELGLVAALEWLAEDFAGRTGIRCPFRTGLETPPQLGCDRATAVFRIAQEALTNVARHAEATEAWISLQADAASVFLEVADNGKGIAGAGRDRSSLGLLGMRERATQLGGELTVTGWPGRGTHVTARIPFDSLSGLRVSETFASLPRSGGKERKIGHTPERPPRAGKGERP